MRSTSMRASALLAIVLVAAACTGCKPGHPLWPADPVAPASSLQALVGLSLRPLTRQEREATQTSGALVVTESTGAAALAGIEPGDIVLAINGTPVQTPEQLRAAMRGTGSTAAVLVQRGAAEIFVPVAIEVASN